MPRTLRVLESVSHDPWFNLALEESLLHSVAPGEMVFYLWRNARTVVIGRHQNPWVECRLDAMEADGVRLARRASGGGAVFHDLGNTNFTFVTHREHYDVGRQIGVITDAVRRMGAAAEFSGRNDIVVDGRKVSGSAFFGRGGRWLHHGTLLLDADLAQLAHYLTASKAKIASKGVASVRARVANLTEFVPGADHAAARDALLASFAAEYGAGFEVTPADPEAMPADEVLRESLDRHRDEGWRFGKTPDFSHHLEQRFPWGGIDLHLDVERGGLIRSVEIFSDALSVDLVSGLAQALRGATYRREDVASRIRRRLADDPDHGAQARDVADWLAAALVTSA